MRISFNKLDNERGVALMMTLWIMIFLTVIATEFAYSMRTEVNITKNFRDSVQAYYLARAAVNRGMVEILQNEANSPHYLDENERLVFGRDEEQNLQQAPQRRYDLGMGAFEYILTDEESKININLIERDSNRETFKKLFITACELEEGTDLDTILDSMADWIDSGDMDAHKINGAEEDYYQGLEVPYHCKNGKFDTIEELQLVKGMNPENFAKVADFILVDKESTSTTIKINRNTSSETVLKVRYTEEEAANIIEVRKTEPYSDRSTHFSVEGIGQPKDSQVKHRIRILFHKGRRDQQSREEYNIYLWNDNMIDIQALIRASTQAQAMEEEL